jgi:hypothetical protein
VLHGAFILEFQHRGSYYDDTASQFNFYATDISYSKVISGMADFQQYLSLRACYKYTGSFLYLNDYSGFWFSCLKNTTNASDVAAQLWIPELTTY